MAKTGKYRGRIKDQLAAIEIFYSTDYIGNREIQRIFGVSQSCASAYKWRVREEEIKQGIPCYVPNHVNKKIAFDVWGIDIKELERNIKKLKEHGLLKQDKEENQTVCEGG